MTELFSTFSYGDAYWIFFINFAIKTVPYFPYILSPERLATLNLNYDHFFYLIVRQILPVYDAGVQGTGQVESFFPETCI